MKPRGSEPSPHPQTWWTTRLAGGQRPWGARDRGRRGPRGAGDACAPAYARAFGLMRSGGSVSAGWVRPAAGFPRELGRRVSNQPRRTHRNIDELSHVGEVTVRPVV